MMVALASLRSATSQSSVVTSARSVVVDTSTEVVVMVDAASPEGSEAPVVHAATTIADNSQGAVCLPTVCPEGHAVLEEVLDDRHEEIEVRVFQCCRNDGDGVVADAQLPCRATD